jgi:hypothetical protein
MFWFRAIKGQNLVSKFYILRQNRFIKSLGFSLDSVSLDFLVVIQKIKRMQPVCLTVYASIF